MLNKSYKYFSNYYYQCIEKSINNNNTSNYMVTINQSEREIKPAICYAIIPRAGRTGNWGNTRQLPLEFHCNSKTRHLTKYVIRNDVIQEIGSIPQFSCLHTPIHQEKA